LNSQIRFDRLILVMLDDELEQFCRTWVERRSGYVEVLRFGGSGDKGRDVVGFLSNQKHEGEWDNYQCKQYSSKLSKDRGLLALGKVIYWISQGEFTSPRKFFFVAPNGVSGPLDALINSPSKLKAALIAEWDTACAGKIVTNTTIKLDAAIIAAIDAFNFTSVSRVTVDEILEDPAAKPLLVEKWGADPGEYPKAAVPADIESTEMAYIRALVDAYGEREKTPFPNPQSVLASTKYGPDLREHRERYFDAESFQKFYRDNTSEPIIAKFRNDVRLGVQSTLKASAADALARVDAVMGQAAVIQPAGPLAKYAYISVKQGVCHHLVNDGEMGWKGDK
jgi:hypothetical protein